MKACIIHEAMILTHELGHVRNCSEKTELLHEKLPKVLNVRRCNQHDARWGHEMQAQRNCYQTARVYRCCFFCPGAWNMEQAIKDWRKDWGGLK